MKQSIYDMLDAKHNALFTLRGDLLNIEKKMINDLKQPNVTYTREDINVIIDDIIKALDKSFRVEGVLNEQND